MLNKSICKQCRAKRAKKSRVVDEWGTSHDKMWRDGTVKCPFHNGSSRHYNKITEYPPYFCPFDLEHTVMEDE
jgi:hypothetical protein